LLSSAKSYESASGSDSLRCCHRSSSQKPVTVDQDRQGDESRDHDKQNDCEHGHHSDLLSFSP